MMESFGGGEEADDMMISDQIDASQQEKMIEVMTDLMQKQMLQMQANLQEQMRCMIKNL